MMTRTTSVFLAVFVLAAVACFFFLRSSSRSRETSARTVDEDVASGTAAGLRSRDPGGAVGAAGSSFRARRIVRDEALATGAPLPPRDRARADQMRARILALFAEAGPGRIPLAVDAAPVASGFPEMPGGGPGNQAQGAQGKYIQSVVRNEFFPLARQCYDSLLATHPGLAGKFELKFRIVGDKSVGGVVDEATVGGGSEIVDADFSECMTQSMMSVSFDAPPGDRDVTVTYPIVFTPGDAEPDSGT